MLRLIQNIKSEISLIQRQIKAEEKIIKSKKVSPKDRVKAAGKREKLVKALEGAERLLRNGLM